MALPTVRQITAVDSAAAYSSPRNLIFLDPVLAGSTIVLMGRVYNASATSLAGTTNGVTMTGGTFERLAEISQRYGIGGMTTWAAPNVAGGATTVTYTPAYANGQNYSSLIAVEVVCRTDSPVEAVATRASEHGVFNISVGPAPAVGAVSQADTLALVCTVADGSTNPPDINWSSVSGWVPEAETIDSQNGLRPLYLLSRAQSTTEAYSVTIGSQYADVSGRVAALLVLRGTTVDPTPPPPAPTPSPPPPGPEPAPPPAPGPEPAPAPAPSGLGFEFLNLDPLLANVVTGVIGQVHAAPTTEPLLGAFIQGFTAETFEVAGAYSKVVVPHDGVVPVTLGQTVKAIGQNAGGTAGFRGVISGTVVQL